MGIFLSHFGAFAGRLSSTNCAKFYRRGICICGQCGWFHQPEDEVIEVIELSSDSNFEVEINVGENEAPEVESPRFVLPDSLGYNPTSPEGVAQSPFYSTTSPDYFPSDSLYSPTSGPVFSDFLETEKEVEAVEEAAPELATETVEPAAAARKKRYKKRRIHFPQKFPPNFILHRKCPEAPQYSADS